MVYTFTVKTKDQSKAGTDSNIYFTLVSPDGKKSSTIRTNGYIKGNAYERGDEDSFAIKFNGFDDAVEKLIIRSDMKYAGAGWKCEYVKACSDAGVSYFNVNEWIQDHSDHTYTKTPISSSVYTFTVKTSDELYAGTDANIYFTLVSPDGTKSSEIRTNSHIKGNAYEKNDLDTFSIDFVDFDHAVEKLIIRSDVSYAGADWRCDYVKSHNSTYGTATFDIYKWICDKENHEYTANK